MACDEDILPLQARVETDTDEAELDEVHRADASSSTITCTDARSRLLVAGIEARIEF